MPEPYTNSPSCTSCKKAVDEEIAQTVDIPGENDFNKLLAETVNRLKENDEFRSDYTAMNLHDRDIKKAAREEGIAEGQQEKAIEDALILIKDFHAEPELAAKKMNAPLDKVLATLNTK